MITLLAAMLLFSSIDDGKAAMANGDYDTAIRIFESHLKDDPGSYEAKFQLARALSFSGKRRQALLVYSDMLAQSPTNSDLLLGRGRVYAWEGRWAESEADLAAAAAKSPAYADVWSALGDMYLWSDRYDKSIEAYGKWIELKPEDPNAWIARAKAHRAAGSIDAAIGDFAKAKEKGGDAGEINSMIAALQRRFQNPDATVPEGYRWSFGVSGGITQFSPTRADWREGDVSIRRYFSKGSLAFEYLLAERFTSSDDAFALDAYVDLWPRSYANLRYQHSPDGQLYPDDSWRAEIFQGVLKGWELSASYDHMEYGNSDVDMYGPGLGKYIGNWYLRWKTLLIPNSGWTNLSHSMLARYYWSGDADNYIELNGGFSRGGDLRRDGYSIQKSRSESIGMSVQKYFLPWLGVKISGGYGDEENSFVDRDVSVGITTRW